MRAHFPEQRLVIEPKSIPVAQPSSVVEDFINRPENSKDASPANQPYDNPDTERAFEYMKRGREERFQVI